MVRMDDFEFTIKRFRQAIEEMVHKVHEDKMDPNEFLESFNDKFVNLITNHTMYVILELTKATMKADRERKDSLKGDRG